MASEGALLALIVDDVAAIQVLAAWAAAGCMLAELEQQETIALLSALAGVPHERTASALKKLNAARVLVDGDITEMADRLLQSHVQASLGTQKKKR